jgi:chemotaxis protein methyltransferase CheR
MKESFERILAGLLESRTGQQLGANRRWRIDSALGAIMRSRGFANLDELAAAIIGGRDPATTEAVIEALLNNETYFYRDRLPFDLLVGGPLGRLETARARDRRLAIWCAGCSTGQEAFSLAMHFAEHEAQWRGWTIDIVGTDVSRKVIDQARTGIYSQFEVQRGLPARQMLTWFDELGGGQWQVTAKLRERVRFECANILDVPPRPGRFDIILCRNLLMYLSPESRRLAFTRLAGAIAADGTLMLGAGETVMGQTEAFISDIDHRGLYVPAGAGGRAAGLPAARVA